MNLIYWEKVTLEILDKLSAKTCFHSHFKQILITNVREDVLQRKIKLYSIDKVFQTLGNEQLASMADENDYNSRESSFPSFFKKLHNSQCSRLRRILPSEESFTIKMGQILNSYRVISTSTPAPEYSQKYINYFNVNQKVFWEGIAGYETKVLNARIRSKMKASGKGKQDEPQLRPFASFISIDYDIVKVTTLFRKLIKGKKGKKLAAVLYAAKQSGILTKDTVPFSTLKKEFDVYGAESGYYYYVNGDILKQEDYRHILEHFKQL